MIRFDLRTFTRGSSAVLASAFLAFGAGCAGGLYVRPAYVEVPRVVAGPAENDGDVVYVQDAPVVDIGIYPSVLYGGFNVYYVDGRWYQQGPRGWAYYRQEPPELGRQREEHWGRDHDPRWGVERGAEPRGRGERAVPPAQRSGATEAQPADRRAAPSPTAQPRRREETQATPAPRRAPSVRRAPSPSPAPTGPERR